MLKKTISVIQYASSICILLVGLISSYKDLQNLKNHPEWSASVEAVYFKFIIVLVAAFVVFAICSMIKRNIK